MDWLEFRPWSREVERYCRTCLEEASHEPRPRNPSDAHSHPRERLRESGQVWATLTELSAGGDDDAPPQRLA